MDTQSNSNKKPTTQEAKAKTYQLGNKVITLRLRDKDYEVAESYGNYKPAERPWMLSRPGKNSINSRNIKRAKSPLCFIISKIGELFPRSK